MSATPIPRSSLTIYGEGTDVYNIIRCQQEERRVITKLTENDSMAYEFMK